ncbi:MAG TPA: porin [Ideonella sp.]|uniref:porin n=1 Tax=Ideonella sp. TaxID=1929293 RepID=UPI002E34C46C|nr:porin [Ideonella sp.]HEX5684220.1 porin [Ideonella sp.]
MKKQFALGLLAAVAASGAFAQSSVTVYGRLNVTLESQKVGEDGDRFSEVNNNSSRIGFKGTEDLGGGLKAGFQIEHGFDPTNGKAADTFWGRQSEVNLGGGFGTVRLGNFTPESYYATADYISMHNHDTGLSSDTLYAFDTYVTANKVGYASPNFGGFQFHASVAEGSATTERTYDLAGNFDRGPLHLGAGFSKQDENKQFALRGLYEMGAFTVGAYYQRATLEGAGNRNNFRLAGMYAFGANELHLNVGRTGDYSEVDDSGATQWTVGYNYNLSKRTKVYGYYTSVNVADDAAQFYGDDRNSFALGIRHNF